MKNIVKISFLLICLFMMSCSDKDDDFGNSPETPWDKSRTAKIMVISNLSEGNLFPEMDYSVIAHSINETEHTVVLLDRSNVSFTSTTMNNPGVNVAYLSKHLPVFVPIDKNDNTYTGSTVLFDKTIESLEQRKVTDNCWLMRYDLDFTSTLSMNFSTISFTNENQLDAGIAAIKSSVRKSTLVVGVVKRSMFSSFESKVDAAFENTDYMLEFLETPDATNDYCIYVLGSPKWKFRELTQDTISGNIQSFLVEVEYLK